MVGCDFMFTTLVTIKLLTMAKSDGIIKIQGTLDNMTFYKSRDGDLVRKKGGISKKRMMKDPAFARTRENLSEFSNNAQSGKLVRMAVNDLMQQAKDSRVTSRLVKVMNQIQKLDTVDVRGKRTVAVGIEEDEGKAMLLGFNFNNRANLSSVLKALYTTDAVTGEVSIPGFVPASDLSIPEGATHVSLRSAFVTVDFNTGEYNGTTSPVENLELNMDSTDVDLIPASVPPEDGIDLILLLIEFYQEVNQIQYPMRNGAHNSLCIVDVG